MPFTIIGVSPLQSALQFRHSEIHYHCRMLNRGEGSAHSSVSEPDSMEVPGERTPPSEVSKEDKVEVPCKGKGKIPNGTSPEKVKEPPKPRASVLEYKSVSQVYVLRV